MLTDTFYTTDCDYATTIEGRVFIQIWKKVMREYFREYSYMAEQAGLVFNIVFDEDCIEFFFRGYADQIEEHVYTIMNKLKNFDPTKAQHIFKMKKETWIKGKRNFFNEEPLEQINIALNRALYCTNFTIKHLLHVGRKFTFERFCEMSSGLLKNGRHLWFGIGNITGNL